MKQTELTQVQEALEDVTQSFAERCRVAEDCLPDAPYRDRLVALHREMLDTLLDLASRLEQTQRRLNWAANELLACDYGDNDAPGEQVQVGWIVYGWRRKMDMNLMRHNEKPRIYGPTIDAAIDAALGEQQP